jgi:hypothetical protein
MCPIGSMSLYGISSLLVQLTLRSRHGSDPDGPLGVCGALVFLNSLGSLGTLTLKSTRYWLPRCGSFGEARYLRTVRLKDSISLAMNGTLGANNSMSSEGTLFGWLLDVFLRSSRGGLARSRSADAGRRHATRSMPWVLYLTPCSIMKYGALDSRGCVRLPCAEWVHCIRAALLLGDGSMLCHGALAANGSYHTYGPLSPT